MLANCLIVKPHFTQQGQLWAVILFKQIMALSLGFQLWQFEDFPLWTFIMGSFWIGEETA